MIASAPPVDETKMLTGEELAAMEKIGFALPLSDLFRS